mgnify:CR=1 FL=1
MAVNVNNVYQKVLALANKEQRGYITPQEFNYFADQAQLGIFENYFYDATTAQLRVSKSSDYVDESDILKEKLDIHRISLSILTHVSSNRFTLPSGVYVLDFIITSTGKIANEVTFNQYNTMALNSLTAPTDDRPIFHRGDEGDIFFYPTTAASGSAVPFASFYQKPTAPDWGYVVINGKALYNSATSTDFDLHESEENNLVMRILELSGITLKDQALTETALRDQAKTKAEKNN